MKQTRLDKQRLAMVSWSVKRMCLGLAREMVDRAVDLANDQNSLILIQTNSRTLKSAGDCPPCQGSGRGGSASRMCPGTSTPSSSAEPEVNEEPGGGSDHHLEQGGAQGQPGKTISKLGMHSMIYTIRILNLQVTGQMISLLGW